MSNILSNQATPLSFIRVKADKLNEIPIVEGQFILTDNGEIWHDINQNRARYGSKAIIINGKDGEDLLDVSYAQIINYLNKGYQIFLRPTTADLYFPFSYNMPTGPNDGAAYFNWFFPASNQLIQYIISSASPTMLQDTYNYKEKIDQINTNAEQIKFLLQKSLILEELTYDQLKLKRDTTNSETETPGSLTPGAFYAITDYEFIPPSQDYASGGHGFDIIVQALDDHTLSETAYARANSNSIDGTNYATWELKYCLDNDDSRFEWATAEGKGIIYYMKDEHNNECSYDFKNVMFKWSSNLQTKHSDYFEAIGLQAGQTEYFYTFSALLQKNEEDPTSGKAIDITSYTTGCHNNNICFTTLPSLKILQLNGNIFIAGNWDTKEGFDEGTISSCYNNLHGYQIQSNIFFSTCHNNILKGICYANIFFKSTNNVLAKGNNYQIFNTSHYITVQENGLSNHFIAAKDVKLGPNNRSIELNNVNNIQFGYDNYGIIIKYSKYIQFNNDNKYITIDGDENTICEFTTIDSGYKYTAVQPLVLNQSNAYHHYYSKATYAKELPDASQ